MIKLAQIETAVEKIPAKAFEMLQQGLVCDLLDYLVTGKV